MVTTELSPDPSTESTDEQLRAWDWKADLKREERSMSWLARHTQRSESAVNKYASGAIPTPIVWLRMAAAALGRGSNDAE